MLRDALSEFSEQALHELHVTATALDEAHALARLGSAVLDLRTRRFWFYGFSRTAFGCDTIALDEALELFVRASHPDDVAGAHNFIDKCERGEPSEDEFRLLIDGEHRWIHSRSKVVHGRDGAVTSIVTVGCDITERKREADRLRALAFIDPDTGLPNRASLFEPGAAPDVVESMLLVHFDWVFAPATASIEARARRARQAVAILCRAVPSQAVVARYAANTYAVIVPQGRRARLAPALARRIVEAFDRPIDAGEDEFVVTPTIGVASGAPHTLAALSIRAESSLARARGQQSRIVAYTPAIGMLQERRATIERHLRDAVTDKRLRAVYQPIVSAGSGTIVAAEALMRWDCPGLGAVSPNEFIEIAEESGGIVRLGAWMLREACAQARSWQLAGHHRFRIAVNISARQAQERDFVKTVAKICEQTGLEPADLELELTEAAMMDREGVAARNLTALQRLGVRISVDDFGTGYSALAYLGDLPRNTLKLDRTFVAPIGSDPFRTEMTAAIVTLAHRRGLTVIGEGVENVAQLEKLRAMGCDEVQGFLLGRPCAPEDFSALLMAAATNSPAARAFPWHSPVRPIRRAGGTAAAGW